MPWCIKGTADRPHHCEIVFENEQPYVPPPLLYEETEFERSSHKYFNNEVMETFYESGFIPKRRKTVPALMSFRGRTYVSQSLKDLIEELEPDQHQFIPFNLRMLKTGEPVAEQYYTLVITTKRDTIWMKHDGEARPARGDINAWYAATIYSGRDYTGIAEVYPKPGKHLWWEARATSDGFFCSDEFMKRFEKAKFKGHEKAYVPAAPLRPQRPE